MEFFDNELYVMAGYYSDPVDNLKTNQNYELSAQKTEEKKVKQTKTIYGPSNIVERLNIKV